MIESPLDPARPKSVSPEDVIADPNVLKLYMNGFALGLGNADMQIIMQLNGRPVAVVNMSYTLAKTLQDRIGRLVADFEAKTDRRMLRTDEVDTAFAEERKG